LIESSNFFLPKARACIREWTFMLVSKCLFQIPDLSFNIILALW
jgi:hypothetical protein